MSAGAARVILAIILCACIFTGCYFDAAYAAADAAAHVATSGNASDAGRTNATDAGGASAIYSGSEKLICRHSDMNEFFASVRYPRSYAIDGNTIAGVVPHHLTAAALISGFFESCAAAPGGYDTVVIIATNHAEGFADIVYSRGDWDVFGEVFHDTEITNALADIKINGVSIEENNSRVEDDHSASVLVPYIAYYLDGAKIVPALVSRSLSLDGAVAFASALKKIIKESGKRVLLVCSIDFSHFLSPAEAAKNDAATAEAINMLDYGKIHNLSNEYIDSPAALIIFLRYLTELGAAAEIIDNTDASEFIGPGINETTSYFVIRGSVP